MTEFVLLVLAGLFAWCCVLTVVTRRQTIELDALRRWRHNLVAPALVRGEELYARTHASVGLPSIEAMQRVAASVKERMPS